MPTSSPRGRRSAAPVRRQLLAVLTAAFIILQPVLFNPPRVAAQVTPTLGVPYTQNFDTLPASGSATWTNNSTIPGWFHARTGTGTTIVANNGSSNAGNLYSYGTGTATDRALGSVGSGNAAIGNLFWGVRLQNNTGSTITSLDVSYTGEQWRNSAAAAQTISFSYLVGSPTVTGSLAEFQSAGVAVPQLDFTSPITGGTAGALDGNLAANRVTLTHSITGLSIPNGTEIMLRWSDPDHTGADHGLSIDDFSVTPQGATPSTTLNINDVSQNEGSGGGTTSFTFTVSLNTTTHGGVTFDIATADGTAQDDNPATEDNDYVAKSLTGQTIPNGSDTYQFTVDVNADTTAESNETFFVNVTNVVGATVGDGQGQGTVTNDDITVTPIHDIQGNGTASPLAGQVVSTTGIVTLLKTGSNAGAGAANGYFLQAPDADADADPNTSEGIFVFTSSVPTVAVGDEITVTGTVTEFNGLTEITSVTATSVIDTGNTLPTAVTLDSVILDPTAAPTQPQLEKYESMRLTASSLVTVAPNDNFFDVYTVLSSVARPMREPGIPASDPIPPDPTSGTPDANIPIWDENPERLKVDTNGRAGAANAAYTSNVTFTAPAGPLDYAFGEYRLVIQSDPAASTNMSAVAVPTPNADEFTVASYNIENFNNNATQREKAALTIRTVLHYPDIIGVVEIFDLADLEALRDEINNDAIAASEPNPMYEAYLVEADGTSEDSDQDVGFLVKTSRVSVTSVTQEREESTYVDPVGGDTEMLHDRPPLLLDAIVDPSGANPRRVLVLSNHLRSFIDIELVAGEGVRVREKRKKQAEDLADLLNDLQAANTGVPVISVGDYNAFQFNSGYDDSLSVIKGTPTADDEIVVDASPDLVDPDFLNLIDDLPAAEQYSFIFEGTPQALDHHVVNGAARSRNTRIAVARVNADFPEAPAAAYASNAAVPERNSDHDPVVSYYSLAEAQAAGSLIISEFRFHGPNNGMEEAGPVTGGGDDPGGPNAPGTALENDEYIEFYNNTDSDITVSTLDGSPGWALVASDGQVRFIIPNGTVIPARHHFLAVNTDGYSLTDYGLPDSVLLPDGVTPAAGYNIDIPDESGIALFRTANSLFFTTEERLDAVGYASVPELYREGAGLTAGAEIGSEIDYAWLRQMCAFVQGLGCSTPGTPKDTGVNATDFISVDTAGVTQSLGAPGPEGLSSPRQRNADFTFTLLDNDRAQAQTPNRVRDLMDTGQNKSFGTMSIRRTVINNTGGPVDYLAFRIVQITTFPQSPGVADLRALDSSDISVTLTNGTPVDVRGTYVEQPPTQLNGGALNSSLGVGYINIDENTLEDGETIHVQFLLGVEKTGTFRFYINIEAFDDCGCPASTLSPGAAKWMKSLQKKKPRASVQSAPRPKARGGSR
ncbi:MAG TPA: hypothetical protein VFZ44_20215 [Pyrinomonadaceae bacterium]